VWKTAVFLLRSWSWWNKNMGWVVLPSTATLFWCYSHLLSNTYTMKGEQVLAFYKAVKFIISMSLVVFLIFPCPLNHSHRFSLWLVLIIWIWNAITLSYIFNSLPSVMPMWISFKLMRCYQFIINYYISLHYWRYYSTENYVTFVMELAWGLLGYDTVLTDK
jgi:hypothetical protein